MIDRYRRAVRAYTEAVQTLAGATGIAEGDYDIALKKVEQAHRVCEQLREALKVYPQKDVTSESVE